MDNFPFLTTHIVTIFCVQIVTIFFIYAYQFIKKYLTSFYIFQPLFYIPLIPNISRSIKALTYKRIRKILLVYIMFRIIMV